jgi:photosystem II stability/assembly factor-like uncharacterized protein/PKD repeat protein
MQTFLLTLVTLFTTTALSAQEWYDLMTGPNPNLFEVTRSYDTYYATHPFVKNGHTQEYKRWVRMMKDHADANGYRVTPVWSREDDARFLAARRSVRRTAQTQAEISWKGLGPFTWDKSGSGIAYAPGQAHCYTVVPHPRDTATAFAGTATAGVWRTTNNGLSWTNVTADLLVREVKSIVVNQHDPSIVYIGCSIGVLRSNDGGFTWSTTGLTYNFFSNFSVWDMTVHDVDGKILLVASNQGLYRSTDAGATFTRVSEGETYEIEKHPTKPSTLYAVRKNGDGCLFLRTNDGGTTWTSVGTDLPVPNTTNKEHTRRWEIAVTPAAPQSVYLFAPGVMNGMDGTVGMYVSTDEGQSFQMRCCGDTHGGAISTTNPNFMAWRSDGQEAGGQYYYDLSLAVSPTDPELVYISGINVWKSTNGGRSFACNAGWVYDNNSRPRYTHADVHDVRVAKGSKVWIASDGGVFVSWNNGENVYERTNGIQGTEFWGWGAGQSDCDVMLGGTYHNGVMLKDNDVYQGWLQIFGGDNNGGLVNYADDRTVYADVYLNQPWHRVKLSGDRTKPLTKTSMGIKVTGNVVQHPNTSQELWASTSRALMRSIDHGASWNAVDSLPGTDVERIRISERDPNVMVMLTKPGYWDTVSVHRSTDAGATWTLITPPQLLIFNNRWRINDVAIDGADARRIWLTVGGNRNEKGKVIVTTDAGATWTDVTGTLPSPGVNCIVHQLGSKGGIYIGTQLGVYYRDDTMQDWMLYGSDLPVIHVNVMEICYPGGTIRAAGTRGVYDAPLYARSAPMARPSVTQRMVACTRDTVHFYDNSICDQNAVQRTWTFEGGTPATSTSKTPFVTYAAPGTYAVSLRIVDPNGVDERTLDSWVTVLDDCRPQPDPGTAMILDGASSVGTIPPLDVTLQATTMSAWIKRTGNQKSFAGIIFARGTSANGLSISTDNKLRVHWNDRGYNFVPTQTVPADEWVHVALVVDPEYCALYINGVADTLVQSNAPADIASVLIGRDAAGDRYFKGLIDEVRIYDRALSAEEIITTMHLTTPDQPGLIAYYQFNEGNSLTVDRIGSKHATLTRMEQTASAVPVGPGVSEVVIANNGVVASPGTGVELNWLQPAPTPPGRISVTRLTTLPYSAPVAGRIVDSSYYIIRAVDAGTFSAPQSISFGGITIQPGEEAGDLSLRSRVWNGEGAWSVASIAAVAASDNGPHSGSARFERPTMTSSSQLAVASTNVVSVTEEAAHANVMITPHPFAATLTMSTSTPCTYEIVDLRGVVMQRGSMERGATIDTSTWPIGVYAVRLQHGGLSHVQFLLKGE